MASSAERAAQRLALQGGMKAVSSIEGRGEPKIGVEEFLAVAERFGLSEAALARIREVVEAEEWGSGPFLANYYSDLPETKVQAFERVARETFGSRYAIGVSSGTAALNAAFTAVGVGPGTEVICPAIGFIATAAAVVFARGVPVFCDVDESLHMDPTKIEALISDRTVALAPTHVLGGVCDMEAITAVARRRGLRVVEDCAQSCGGTQNGQMIGTFGDVGCFSISAYKIVGGGEGGLIITDDELLHNRAQGIVECGGLWRPDRFAPPRYPGELFSGTNYRMSEMEAAVDAVQLAKAPKTVARFRAVYTRILSQLRTYRQIVPQKLNDPSGAVGYCLRFYPESIELGQRIVEALAAEGISASISGADGAPDWHIYHSMSPITEMHGATAEGCPYRCPIYLERGGSASYARGDCPVADDLFDRVVSINLNQWYTPSDADHIAQGINKVLAAYCDEDPDATPWL